MPLGIVIIKWDNRLGGVIEARCTRSAWVPPSFATTVFSMHFPNMKVGINPVEFIKTKVGRLKVYSYFDGESERATALILSEREKPEEYTKKILKLTEKISKNLSNYINELPKWYSKIFK